MARVLHGFDLNVRMEEDGDGNLPFNLNEPILEDHNNNGNVRILTHFFFPVLIFTVSVYKILLVTFFFVTITFILVCIFILQLERHV